MRIDTVVVLKPNDRVLHESGPIVTIYRNLDAAAADQVVSRALSEIGLAMATLCDDAALWEPPRLERHLRRLQHMAENLGMVTLSMVAGDLRTCHAQGDSTAIAAVLARLRRVAERCLAAEPSIADRSH